MALAAHGGANRSTYVAEEPGLTLSNVLAQKEAQILIDTSADYFE